MEIQKTITTDGGFDVEIQEDKRGLVTVIVRRPRQTETAAWCRAWTTEFPNVAMPVAPKVGSSAS